MTTSEPPTGLTRTRATRGDDIPKRAEMSGTLTAAFDGGATFGRLEAGREASL